MIRTGVSEQMFLLVLAHPGSTGQRTVKHIYAYIHVNLYSAKIVKKKI